MTSEEYSFDSSKVRYAKVAPMMRQTFFWESDFTVQFFLSRMSMINQG